MHCTQTFPDVTYSDIRVIVKVESRLEEIEDTKMQMQKLHCTLSAALPLAVPLPCQPHSTFIYSDAKGEKYTQRDHELRIASEGDVMEENVMDYDPHGRKCARQGRF